MTVNKQAIFDLLLEMYPDAKPELDFEDPYQTLVATILAAQCTDKRVNQVTPAVFRDFPTPAAMAQTTPEILFPFPVDTHVFRLTHRLGLVTDQENTPDKVDEAMRAQLPPEKWGQMHHALIYHGRRVCHSQKPDCAACRLAEYCPSCQNM